MGHTYRGPKSGCKLVTLFDSYSNYGVNATIGVQHTEVPNQGNKAWAYLWRTIGWAYTRAYLEHILGITRAYLRHILVMSWVYIQHILGMS